jgi:hypothetical protein
VAPADRTPLARFQERRREHHERAVAVRLNRSALEHAQALVKQGEVVLDDRDDWSEHQPSAEQENRFIDAHGWSEYSKWHLGVDDEHGVETKGRYKFPYGDFARVHRCGVLAAESRAAQYDYEDIARAVAHLHGMLEALV